MTNRKRTIVERRIRSAILFVLVVHPEEPFAYRAHAWLAGKDRSSVVAEPVENEIRKATEPSPSMWSGNSSVALVTIEVATAAKLAAIAMDDVLARERYVATEVEFCRE